jgi:hypothetical protein
MWKLWIAFGAAALAATMPATATVVTFDEPALVAQSGSPIGNFYDGGGGGSLGIAFGGHALAFDSSLSSFANSSPGVMWLSDPTVGDGDSIIATIDVAAGFTSFFSFDWNGRDAFTVTLSGSGTSPIKQTFGIGLTFPGWTTFSMGIVSGTVTHVEIQGGSNLSFFDNMSFGVPAGGGGGTGMPEPGSLALAGLALAVMGATARLGRRR